MEARRSFGFRKSELGYSLIPLLWHEARIEITAVDPAINLQRESDGEWNLMKALASKSPAAASSGSTAFTIYLDKLGVRNAAIDLAPQGASGPHYRFEAADLDADLAIKSAGLEAELTELRTRIAAPGMPPADLYAAAFLQQREWSGESKNQRSPPHDSGLGGLDIRHHSQRSDVGQRRGHHDR